MVISALLRDSSTRNLLLRGKFALLSPDVLLPEIERHIAEIALRSGMPINDTRLILSRILERIEFVSHFTYEPFLAAAANALTDRDDAPFLAVAIVLGVAIWSDDKGFRRQGLAPVIATSDLLHRENL